MVEQVAEKVSQGFRTREERDATLRILRSIAGDEGSICPECGRAPANDNARVAAVAQIAAIQGFRDMVDEEDEEEGEERTIARFRKNIERKGDLEEEFRKFLRDPAILQRVERLCGEIRATL